MRTDILDVLADRHRTRYEFKNRVTYGSLKQILSGSHSKMLAIKGFTAKKVGRFKRLLADTCTNS